MPTAAGSWPAGAVASAAGGAVAASTRVAWGVMEKERHACAAAPVAADVSGEAAGTCVARFVGVCAPMPSCACAGSEGRAEEAHHLAPLPEHYHAQCVQEVVLRRRKHLAVDHSLTPPARSPASPPSLYRSHRCRSALQASARRRQRSPAQPRGYMQLGADARLQGNDGASANARAGGERAEGLRTAIVPPGALTWQDCLSRASRGKKAANPPVHLPSSVSCGERPCYGRARPRS